VEGAPQVWVATPAWTGFASTLANDAVSFKLNQDRRHHIPRLRHKVVNWPGYQASPRQRGSLTKAETPASREEAPVLANV
jgi:hypothetical protein